MSDTGVAWRQVRHPLPPQLQLQLRKIQYSGVDARYTTAEYGAQLYPLVPCCVCHGVRVRAGARARARPRENRKCLDSHGITVNATEWALFPALRDRYLCTRRNIPGDLTTECPRWGARYDIFNAGYIASLE